MYYFSDSGNSYYGILVDAGYELKAIATKNGYLGSGVVSLKGEYKSVVVDLNSQWRTLTDLNVEYDSSSYDAYESFSNQHFDVLFFFQLSQTQLL